MAPRTASAPALRAAARVGFVYRLAEHGERVALIEPGNDGRGSPRVTYSELASAVDARASELTSPVGARRLVLIGLDRSLEAVTTYLATLAAGHVALLASEADHEALLELTATYDPDVIAYRADGSWTTTERHAESVHTLHPDLALLLSTSGSTGSPKLVRLSAENLQANAHSIVEALRITPDDRAVTTLPLTYSYGLSVLHSHLEVGASVVLSDDSVVDARFWDAVAEHAVTTLPGVPHTFDLLDRVGFARQRLPHLAHVTVAGGRLAPERVKHYAGLGERMGYQLHVMYGQTEATARIATLDPELALDVPESIGRPVPGGSIELSSGPDDEPGVGEIVYRGPNVMLGYAEQPADLALGRTVDALHTGDLAARNADGTFRIVGRRSRVAKIFGLRIDLDRVEQVLASEGITAAVVGEDVGLCVVAEGRVDREHLADRTARAAGLPMHVVHARVVDALPRLASGKLDRSAVDCRCGSHDASKEPDTVGVGRVTAQQITALFAQLLGRPDATARDSFVSLGGDSLSFVEVSVRLESMLGQLPTDWHLRSPEQLAASGSVAHRWTAQLDTGVVLRAVAIVAIVGTHIGLFELMGGAHVLLGLAGFSMARFLLDRPEQPAPDPVAASRSSTILRSAVRIAVPSALWIGLAALLTADYTWRNAALLGTVLGPDQWGPAWHFWFVEALVLYLLAAAALFAIPAFDRVERTHPFLVPGVLVAIGLVVRFGAMPGLTDPRPSPAPAVYFFWFFALGWWAARATSTWQRLLVSSVVVVAVPGYWGSAWREGAVIVGLLVLTWFSTIRVPRVSVPLLTRLAAASLAIYLTHWVVYPPLDEVPLVALVASLAVGVAAYEGTRLAMKAAKSFSFWSAYAKPYSTRARSARSPLPR
ncbi:MAG TPA: AMP-binding protein [Actinomycetes bacterium]|nr:AMP-binding protein [Actinomycetes bacterium]